MSAPVQVVAGIAVRDGKVLLIRSRKHGVATPGGKVNAGETHEQCLRREVMEETGLPVVRFGRFLHTDAQPTFHCHLYAMEVPHWEPVAGDDAEAAWWGDPAEILASSIPRDYPLALDVIANGVDDAASLRAELLDVGRALGFDHIPGDVGAKVRSVTTQSTANALAAMAAEQDRDEARLRAIAAEGAALVLGRRRDDALARAKAAEAELAALRAIVDGRAKPPSVEEIVAHAAAHPYRGATDTGLWLAQAPDDLPTVTLLHCANGRVWARVPGDDWQELPDNPGGTHAPGSRWWPLDGEGRPCAWPAAKG